MPDFSVPMGQSWFPQSRAWSEIDQPTQTGALVAPFGGNPQQMAAMLQQPAVQQQMAAFGMHFNPQQIQQSPFFSNQFMGHHPALGGAMSGAMMGAAATPSPTGPEGAGGGISRVMQGAMGGPEMARQFQMRQMQMPFQGMAAMIPGMEFQRKQQLLTAVQGNINDEEDIRRQSMELQQYFGDLKQQYLDQGQAEKAANDRALQDIKQQLADTRQQMTQQQSQWDFERGQMTRPVPGFMGGQPGMEVYQPGQGGKPGGWQWQAGPNLFKPGNAPGQLSQNQIATLRQRREFFNTKVPPPGSGFEKNPGAGRQAADQKGWDDYRQRMGGMLDDILKQSEQPLTGSPGAGLVAPGLAGAPGGQGTPGPQGLSPETAPPGAQIDEQGNVFGPNGQFLGTYKPQ